MECLRAGRPAGAGPLTRRSGVPPRPRRVDAPESLLRVVGVAAHRKREEEDRAVQLVDVAPAATVGLMIERLIDRPMPIPPGWVVTKASNSSWTDAGSMPIPPSCTATMTRSSSCRADRMTSSRGRSGGRHRLDAVRHEVEDKLLMLRPVVEDGDNSMARPTSATLRAGPARRAQRTTSRTTALRSTGPLCVTLFLAAGGCARSPPPPVAIRDDRLQRFPHALVVRMRGGHRLATPWRPRLSRRAAG